MLVYIPWWYYDWIHGCFLHTSLRINNKIGLRALLRLNSNSMGNSLWYYNKFLSIEVTLVGWTDLLSKLDLVLQPYCCIHRIFIVCLLVFRAYEHIALVHYREVIEVCYIFCTYFFFPLFKLGSQSKHFIKGGNQRSKYLFLKHAAKIQPIL